MRIFGILALAAATSLTAAMSLGSAFSLAERDPGETPGVDNPRPWAV